VFRDELFHVSKLQALWRKGYDLWRIKAWDLERQGYRYRIVYAFETGKSRHHMLAIAPREFDYDPDHPLSRRILAALRQRKGLSQAALAKTVGTSQSHIARLEKGHDDPRLSTIQRLANALDTGLDEIAIAINR